MWFGVGGRLESGGARLLAAVAVYLLLSFGPAALADLPPPTLVGFEGHTARLDGEPTVHGLFEHEGLHVKVGRLLDVTGAVLKDAAYPPHIFVDSRPATEATRLRSGDVVVLDGGRDVYEPSIVETFANAGGNPQYKLGNGVVTVRRGLISKSTVPVAAEGKGPPQVALTFDDGPNPDATPQILDVLRRENVKATFFVVGTMAAAYPKLITREVAEGMSIGDHTWTHPHLAGRDATFVRNQLVETRNTLKPLGADVTVFRPPYGSYTATTVQIAQSLGMRTVIWTIDPADYRKPAPTVIVRRVMNQLKPGAIILMHDGGGDRSRTVAALKMLIQQIRKRGYGFSALR